MKIQKKSADEERASRCVVYASLEDGGFVAHGLCTDQVGVGDSPEEAARDYARAAIALLELAEEEPDIQVFRDAPAEVQQRARATGVVLCVLD